MSGWHQRPAAPSALPVAPLHEVPAAVIWSIVPPMDLMPRGWPEPGTPAGRTVELSDGQRLLLVTPTDHGHGVVHRLISGRAADYLDPRWQPGTSVSLPG